MRNKRSLIVVGVVALLGLVGFGLWYQFARPLTKGEALALIHDALDTSNGLDIPATGIQARIISKKYGVDDSYAVGAYHADGVQPLTAAQPFHAASVGKLFTAVTVMQLQAEEKLAISDPIAQYLPAELLAGLFVVDGVDYQGDVTISQLLEHTAGVADYYADPVSGGLTVEQDIVEHPETVWSPEALVAVTRERQQAVGTPGRQFHYSDTGYVLLGLLVEKIERKPFHQVLHDRIFLPLEMDDTYLPTRSLPRNPAPLPIADIWINGVNLRNAASVSADWAGGGVVTTLDDLVRFSTALHTYQLVDKAAYLRMSTMRQQFLTGLYYGVGMMAVRYGEFHWSLDFLPETLGHLGVLGVHCWYEPLSETTVVLNYGSDAMLEQSFMDLITIQTALRRIETP